MLIASVDGLSFYSLAWTSKLLPSKTLTPTYGMLGHSTLHFRDQHVV